MCTSALVRFSLYQSVTVYEVLQFGVHEFPDHDFSFALYFIPQYKTPCASSIALKLPCPDTGNRGRHCHNLPYGLQRKRERIILKADILGGHLRPLQCRQLSSMAPSHRAGDPNPPPRPHRLHCASPQGWLWAQPWGRKSPIGKGTHDGTETPFFLPSGPKAPSLCRYLHMLVANPPASLSRNPLPSTSRALGQARGIAKCQRYTMNR